MIHLFRKLTHPTGNNNFSVSRVDIPPEEEHDFLVDAYEHIEGLKEEFADDTKYKCKGPVFLMWSKG